MAALIRQGKLCRQCSGKKCNDIGTEAEPIDIECPACNGGGCDQCDEGYYRVIGCPNGYCGDMKRAIPLIDLFNKGMAPVAGGVLDQAAWFIDAVRVFEHEESLAKAD